MNKRVLIASALAAAIVGPSLVSAGPAPEPTFKAEKCYGIAKAGKNDCASTGPSLFRQSGSGAISPARRNSSGRPVCHWLFHDSSAALFFTQHLFRL